MLLSRRRLQSIPKKHRLLLLETTRRAKHASLLNLRIERPMINMISKRHLRRLMQSEKLKYLERLQRVEEKVRLGKEVNMNAKDVDETGDLEMEFSTNNEQTNVKNDELVTFINEKFHEMKEILLAENKNLIETMQIANNILQDQLKVAFEAMAEQKVMLNQILRQDARASQLCHNYPVKTEDELAKLDGEITPLNKYAHIKEMKTILQPAGVLKAMRMILTDDLILNFNVDGVQGKKPLKMFQNFYAALLESITISEDSGTAEEQLRKAISLQKKRVFKKISVERKSK